MSIRNRGFFPTVCYPAVATLNNTAADGMEMVHCSPFAVDDDLRWGRLAD